jgi:ferrous iron transport protein B
LLISSRKGTGIDELKIWLSIKNHSYRTCLNASSIDPEYFNSKAFPNQLLYKLWLVITQDVNFLNLERKIQGSFTKSHSDLKRLQQKKPLSYQFINDVLKRV